MRFVLVHGGFHGAWCWERLIPELTARGHEAVAPDLPGHGERHWETAGFDAYRETVAEVVEPGDVLVGHSMGGAVSTGAADLVPDRVGRLVYLAGAVPIEGKPLIEALPFAAELAGLEFSESAFWPKDLAAATELFFHDCDVETARWAYHRLRPQSLAPFLTPVNLPNFWTAEFPRSYITCTADRSGILASTEALLARLGLDNAHPFWASHSPFLSRPAELADLLVRIASEDTEPLQQNQCTTRRGTD
ncbi:alpha/beta fold hydrolase [Mycobacterium sp. AZCC_0083]|uniref:alpha/beta fold hydrolase n=1 Tax=Mycobacterium sp. AZCC_0083 TaxID=2735882 RepID=UPI001618E548|nr:alpha/beta fold hydrolase [Mycobacterium sp. AZCC_0083]MBB5161527.1 pimeloyl-ACP methyl ester carboxylesterase [Mycobacterium sp. AZCC_0083]